MKTCGPLSSVFKDDVWPPEVENQIEEPRWWNTHELPRSWAMILGPIEGRYIMHGDNKFVGIWWLKQPSGPELWW